MRWRLATAMLVLALSCETQAQMLAPGCYARLYDQRHLATHPQQTVTFMNLRLVSNGRESLQFGVGVRVRGRDALYAGGGACRNSRKGNKVGVYCQIDCDGGGFFVEQSGGGLLLHLAAPLGNGSIALSPTCNPEEFFDLKAGLDDKVFFLQPVAAKECGALGE